MNVIKENQDGVVVLKIEGWIDTQAAPALGKEIDEIKEAKEIILDFDKVEYIASSGLRQVVACYNKANELGAVFSVANVGTEVMSIFKMTGLNKKMTVKEK